MRGELESESLDQNVGAVTIEWLATSVAMERVFERVERIEVAFLTAGCGVELLDRNKRPIFSPGVGGPKRVGWRSGSSPSWQWNLLLLPPDSIAPKRKQQAGYRENDYPDGFSVP